MASKYEQAVYDCMNPTLELYERTENPLHRAILLNFLRHVRLEGAAIFDEITDETMMSDNPVYRITWGSTPIVVEGRQGVADFYHSIGEIVLWNSGDLLAVADWGIADEMWFHQMSRGSELKKLGHPIENDDGLYLVSSKQAFIWPYDETARLKGEHLYEDKSTLKIEEIDPADVLTPQRVREIHTECLAAYEQRFGPEYWIYRH